MSCEQTGQVDWAAFLVERDAPEWSDLRDHYPRCPECSREVARWSRLTQALDAEAVTPSSGHPAEQRLLAFQQEPSGLSPSERDSIEDHLAACAPCRAELSVLQGFDFGQLAPSPALEPVRAPAPSLWNWISERIEGMAEVFAPMPRPALGLALVIALLVPAGLVWWQLAGSPADRTAPVPIARDEPLERVEPEVAAPDTREVELAQESAAPAESEGRVEIADPVVEPEAPIEVAETPARPMPEPIVPTAPAREPKEPESIDPEPAAALQIAALVPSAAPRYFPDAAFAASDLGGLRDGAIVRAQAGELPEIRALAPAHVGLTTEASPTLYWFLSSESEVPVEVALIDEEGIDPLLELRIDPPVRAGLHALRLAEEGVRLDPAVKYRWYVSLVPSRDDRAQDVTSGAALRRVPPEAELEASLAEAGPAGRAHVLARDGYWYDAFETLNEWIDAEPDAAILRAHRTALLDQVGLEAVALSLSGDPR